MSGPLSPALFLLFLAALPAVAVDFESPPLNPSQGQVGNVGGQPVALADVDATAPGGGSPRSKAASGCDGDKISKTAGCGVDLSFKYAGKTIKVRLMFDVLREPSSGDGDKWMGGTPDDRVDWFSAANYVKTVGNPSEAWKMGAVLYYGDKQPELPGMDTQAEGQGDWEFGVIQNSEKLVYRYAYGGTTQYGSGKKVEAQLLDMSAADPSGEPFYHPHARAVLAYGYNYLTMSDTPAFNAPVSKKKVETASLKGKWTMWFVLRRKSNEDTIYLYNLAYDISREWELEKKPGGTVVAKGGTVTTTEGLGKGSIAPILKRPATYEELKKEWTKP